MTDGYEAIYREMLGNGSSPRRRVTVPIIAEPQAEPTGAAEVPA